MGLWKLLFKITRRKLDDRKGSWGESFWLWENDLFYRGKETIRMYAPSDMIEWVMDKIEGTNPRALSMIRSVFVRYVRSQFRGSKWVEGYIEGDKEFLGKLIVKAYWEWKDKAWFWGGGDLVIDEEFLNKLRWAEDIDDYLSGG
jgi:hypothetical protein